VVAVAFEQGVPVGINGVRMSLVELVESLTTIAGGHGVGRLDRVKYRGDGTRVRAVYESPAAVVLHRAHLELMRFVSPGPLIAFSRTASSVYADLIGSGDWFSPLRTALDAFVDRTNHPATATVRLRLFKGSCDVVGIEPS
jgi:argininosuccinate synthase